MVSQVNDIAVDRDAMSNYFPNLSAGEFKNVTGHFADQIIALIESNDPQYIQMLRQDKARRFLKKLVMIVNERWISDNATEAVGNEEARKHAEEAVSKLMKANSALKNYLGNP